MKNMVKDAAILLVITVISGSILGVVYQITKEPIALAKEAAAQEAYAEVFPNAASFEKMELAVPDSPEWVKAWEDAGFGGVSLGYTQAACDTDGSFIGYVLTVTSHEGYGGDITFTMGITNDGTLNGISILSISETAGLGMRAEEVLKPQFEQKKVPAFTYTKNGASSDKQIDAQIDAISGATITTNAVTTAVNAGLYYFQTELGGGSYEAK